MEQPEQTEASADKTSSENTNAGEHSPQKSKAAPTPPTSMGPPLLLPEGQKWWQRGKPWAIILVFVILAAGGAYAYHLHQTNTAANQQPANTTKKTPNSIATKPKEVKDAAFLDVPQDLGDLHFFSDLSYFGTTCGNNPNITDPSKCTQPLVAEKDIKYYKVGTTKDGEAIIDASVPFNMGITEYISLETSANHYSILANDVYDLVKQPEQNTDYYQKQLSTFQAALNKNVVLDTSNSLAQLDFPETASIKGAVLTASWAKEITSDNKVPPVGTLMPDGLTNIRGVFYGALTTSSTPLLLGTTQGKNFYEVTVQDKSNYQVKELYGTINKVFSEAYLMNDPMVSDPFANKPTPLQATWSAGATTSSAYASAAPGCGSAYGYMVPKGVSVSNLTLEGTGPQGEKLYELPTSSALLQEYFSDYQSNEQYLQDKSLRSLDLATFQADHAVIIARNPLGELTIYQRADMFVHGGCGKPVLYLYPQKTTDVNVQVGADVVKSDPTYTTNGWQNVTAHPDGSLQYDGKAYGSLYWEGFGDGPYPLLGNIGTVVPRAKVASTIRTQLKEQGFDTKEVSDFLSFWQPKLPTTPYIRLTWLNTAQMNRLAPLNISPRPDILIRTFLDFEGLQTPERLQPQTFVAPARQGFTAVEWGGLLRDGSIQR